MSSSPAIVPWAITMILSRAASRIPFPCIKILDAGGIPVPLVDGELVDCEMPRLVSFTQQFPMPGRDRIVHDILLYALYRVPVHARDPLDGADRHAVAQERAYP